MFHPRLQTTTLTSKCRSDLVDPDSTETVQAQGPQNGARHSEPSFIK